MLIFDIDGTVIEGNGEWVPELKEYINEVADKGCIIAFNTSRYPKDASKITEQLKHKPYTCTCTGGLITNPEGKVISKVPISESYFREYLESIYNTGYNYAIEIYDFANNEALVCTENLTDLSRISQAEQNLLNSGKVVSFHDLYDALISPNRCILAASIIADSVSMTNLKEMRDIMEDATSYHIGFDIIYSDTSAEVVSSNHSKGSAVRRLREKLNPNIIVAVGDSDSDIPAFAEADISIAIKNDSDAWKNSTYVVSEITLVDKLKVLESRGLLY